MKCIIEINCDNAAFEPDPKEEVARILRTLANWLETGEENPIPRDANGNTVGHCTWES